MPNFLRDKNATAFSDKSVASAFSDRNVAWASDLAGNAFSDKSADTIITTLGFGIQGFGTAYGGFTTTVTTNISPWLSDKE